MASLEHNRFVSLMCGIVCLCTFADTSQLHADGRPKERVSSSSVPTVVWVPLPVAFQLHVLRLSSA